MSFDIAPLMAGRICSGIIVSYLYKCLVFSAFSSAPLNLSAAERGKCADYRTLHRHFVAGISYDETGTTKPFFPITAMVVRVVFFQLLYKNNPISFHLNYDNKINDAGNRLIVTRAIHFWLEIN